MTTGLIIAYSATAISISGRFIFMYLLYTKKSTNTYSLVFSILHMVSSSLWITYGQMITDMPLLVRGSSDLVLFSFIRRNFQFLRSSRSPELPLFLLPIYYRIDENNIESPPNQCDYYPPSTES
jgi:hypothetical protein